MRPLVVGTRGSRLALIQTQEVVGQLREKEPRREFVVKVIRSGGDKAAEAPLSSLGLGMFVKELEDALLRGDVDFAVHSLKDLTPVLPQGLTIGAVSRRQDPRDVLINRWNSDLEDLPAGARIGTSSPRRTAQLMHWAPESRVLPMRGSVDTRIRKAAGEDYDGAVLAAAGVIRLGLEDRVSQFLPANRFVPAPGQGALAVEMRADDNEMASMLSGIDHRETRRAVTAERAFLERLGSGCEEPSASYARVSGETMIMFAFMASTDGSQAYFTKTMGRASNPHEVAMEAHQQLFEKGAGKIYRDKG